MLRPGTGIFAWTTIKSKFNCLKLVLVIVFRLMHKHWFHFDKEYYFPLEVEFVSKSPLVSNLQHDRTVSFSRGHFLLYIYKPHNGCKFKQMGNIQSVKNNIPASHVHLMGYSKVTDTAHWNCENVSYNCRRDFLRKLFLNIRMVFVWNLTGFKCWRMFRSKCEI